MFGVLGFTLFGFLGTVEAAPMNYGKLKGGMSVRVYKKGLLSVVAHNHIIEARGFSAKATFDPDNPSACKINISVPVEKMRVDDQGVRSRAGKDFANKISDSQRKEIRTNMLSADQLNAAAHKNITFEAITCKKTGGKKYDIIGNFTLRGKTNKITVKGATIHPDPMPKREGAYRLNLKGSFSIKATDYGFKPYAAAGGAIANKNKMKLKFRLKGESN